MPRRRDTSLAEYRRKRDPEITPEPPGEERSSPTGRLFVIQKHAASRLHYDFRLEHAGALLSWAVPKGPSLDPAVTRLAVRVEDHPIAYGDFEGVIPAGQYGGGTVLLWDRGTWEPTGDPAAGLARGKLRFRLSGRKLTGEWLLARSGGKGDARTEWILRKLADDAARTGPDAAITETRPESVASGRDLDGIAADPGRVWTSHRTLERVPPPSEVEGARRGRLPEQVEPELATLVDEAPAGPDWIHEIKFDGYRALVRLEGGEARVLTRRGQDWTDKLAPIARAAAFLPAESALLDGEAVWLDAAGTSDFRALQRALAEGRSERLYLYAFDLLHLDGWDLTDAPLLERKRLLTGLLAAAPAEAGRLRDSDHVTGEGEAFFRQACELALEGSIAKRAASPYRSGRGRDWVKVKCRRRQELVIVGFTEPSGSRPHLGALLLGVHDPADGPLRFAGKVGTGFDTATLADLRRRLEPLARKTPAVEGVPRSVMRDRPHWTRPELVAEIAFTEWTGDGRLRHPSFVGLRGDKLPGSIVREEPEAPPASRPAPPSRVASPREPKAPSSRRRGKAGGPAPAGIVLTRPDRVLWPDAGVTKRELAEYLAEIAAWMLPHVDGRMLTLLRCPEGIDGECFYQKHLRDTTPDELETVPITEKAGETQPYLVARTPAALVALAQLGVLEIHLWGSRAAHVERPDRLVFDLDPDESVGWPRVVEAGRQLRELLDGLGLASWPLLTGGKGLHVVVPVAPELDWEAARAFSRAVAELLASTDRQAFTVNPLKRHRTGRIFLDYLRNAFGSTAIAPFSTRARPGCPVAVPVDWDELEADEAPRYTVRTVRERLAGLSRPVWDDAAPQRLRPEILRHLAG